MDFFEDEMCIHFNMESNIKIYSNKIICKTTHIRDQYHTIVMKKKQQNLLYQL